VLYIYAVSFDKCVEGVCGGRGGLASRVVKTTGNLKRSKEQTHTQMAVHVGYFYKSVCVLYLQYIYFLFNFYLYHF